MEAILTVLIVALLNGSIKYIDSFLKDIVPMTLYSEKYMTVVSGIDLAETLFDVTFGFGVSMIVLKFLKKGFEIYIMWTDGDADEEPLYLLTNFLRALAVAICFPTLYGWLGGIVEDMTNQFLTTIGAATDFDWQAWVTGISSLGLVTAIFGLIFLICYFMLYFQ